jgi:hypothetical protein
MGKRNDKSEAIMSWHYRIRKRKAPENKKYIFDIVEFYGKRSWTVQGIKPYGDTKEELIQELERMLSDAKKYPVLYDKWT